MIKFKKIKYLKIKKGLFGDSLFIKYWGENEEFLTNGKVDLKDFKIKQAEFYDKAKAETKEMAKGWKERHERYLKLFAK